MTQICSVKCNNGTVGYLTGWEKPDCLSEIPIPVDTFGSQIMALGRAKTEIESERRCRRFAAYSRTPYSPSATRNFS
jgi:hypothetical protein